MKRPSHNFFVQQRRRLQAIRDERLRGTFTPATPPTNTGASNMTTQIYSYAKEAEIRQQAARLGFGNVDEVAAVLAPRVQGASLTTAEAAALLRGYALERPDLVPVAAFEKWTPLELRAAHKELIAQRRVAEAHVLEARHKDALAVADGVAKRQRTQLEDRIQRAKGSAWQAEQQIGGVSGLREQLRVAKDAAWRVAQSGPPETIATQLATANGRVERLTAEVGQLEKMAVDGHAEATALAAELEAWR